MELQSVARFRIDSRSVSHFAKPEFKNRGIQIESSGTDCIDMAVLENGKLGDREFITVIHSVRWELKHRKDNEFWFENNQKRRVPLADGIYDDMLNAINIGELSGNAACRVLGRLFCLLEITHSSENDSWVHKFFPKFFRDERARLDRMNRKIVKKIMQS